MFARGLHSSLAIYIDFLLAEVLLPFLLLYFTFPHLIFIVLTLSVALLVQVYYLLICWERMVFQSSTQVVLLRDFIALASA